MAFDNSSTAAKPKDETATTINVSPLSKELVIGIVGFAGAGCSTTAKRLRLLLEVAGYAVSVVKLSDLIASQFPADKVPSVLEGIGEGSSKLLRAVSLQDLGDDLRENHGHHAVASLAVKKIIKGRGTFAPGERKSAVILDSIKHLEEVLLLRRVYDLSFRLLAVHCERSRRETRLIGNATSEAKYRGANKSAVLKYIDRDEKDQGRRHGQQVRDAFYLADFFVDNNSGDIAGAHLTADLKRFADLLLGAGLVRPTQGERAIYHAHAAALQSACLSRQVGACLMADDGTVLAAGTNDVPKFGGGVYDEDSEPDNRRFHWEWTDGELKFVGCHNQRKKVRWREEVAEWMSQNLAEGLALAAFPKQVGQIDAADKARQEAVSRIGLYFQDHHELLERLPGIKDILEFSRSIHAEMSALFAAARKGVSPVGSSLYCTTYPCHGCSRHMVTAGVKKVFYIEPYVKSLAFELHSDSIARELPANTDPANRNKMTVQPFTGVGPRMYEDYFTKRGELKTSSGAYDAPKGSIPEHAVRLSNLQSVEKAAASLVPDPADV